MHTQKKKKNPTWWHTLVILGPGRQRQWVPGAHWPGSFGEFQASDRTCVKSQGGEHVRSNSRGCPLASTCKHPHSDSHLHRQAPAHSCAHAQKLFFFLKKMQMKAMIFLRVGVDAESYSGDRVCLYSFHFTYWRRYS